MTCVVVLSINVLITGVVYDLSRSNACRVRECKLRVSGLTPSITGLMNVDCDWNGLILYIPTWKATEKSLRRSSSWGDLA